MGALSAFASPPCTFGPLATNSRERKKSSILLCKLNVSYKAGKRNCVTTGKRTLNDLSEKAVKYMELTKNVREPKSTKPRVLGLT